MATTSVALTDTTTPKVEVLTLDTGERFASMRFNEENVSLLLPGTGKAQAEFARQLAIALFNAAAQLELPAAQPVDGAVSEGDAITAVNLHLHETELLV